MVEDGHREAIVVCQPGRKSGLAWSTINHAIIHISGRGTCHIIKAAGSSQQRRSFFAFADDFLIFTDSKAEIILAMQKLYALSDVWYLRHVESKYHLLMKDSLIEIARFLCATRLNT